MFVTSFVIGNVTSFIGQTDRAAAQYQERMDHIRDLMQQRKVTSALRRRILRYFEYAWSHHVHTDEAKLMTELPFSLRLQLTLILHKKLFTDVRSPPAFEELHRPARLRTALIARAPLCRCRSSRTPTRVSCASWCSRCGR